MKKRLALMLPVGLVLTAIVFYSIIDTEEGTIDLDSILQPSLYPAGAVVCSDIIDTKCATQVAQRVGHPVAWLAAGQELRHATFAALNSSAIQDLKGKNMVISVESPPQGPPSGRVSQTVRENGIEAEVRSQSLAGDAKEFEISWTLDGQDYRIGVVAIDSDPFGVTQFLNIWRRVQYTTEQ